MNIFLLSECPVEAAKFQCDKHVNKMALESAQMLCTVHRMLDGRYEVRRSKSGRKLDYWVLSDERENVFYKPVHPNHPCTVWTRETAGNYMWHYRHFIALCEEYTRRYSRIHACQEKFEESLSHLPLNIDHTTKVTEFPLAMKANPECMFEGDPVRSYRAFYQTKQDRFKMVWTKSQIPDWFEVRV
jgi:hypothetical protein